MTIDPELSRQLIDYLSDRDNPAAIFKAIELIQSTCSGQGCGRVAIPSPVS